MSTFLSLSYLNAAFIGADRRRLALVQFRGRRLWQRLALNARLRLATDPGSDKK